LSELGAITPEVVRLWAIVLIGVFLAVGGFISKEPTTLMLGTTLLGTEPLVRARHEPPSEEPSKEAVLA
jgi:hypothetical protein